MTRPKSLSTALLLLSFLLGCGQEGDSGKTPVQSSTPEEPVEVPADYVETIRGSDVQFEMVWVPDGNFWIGRTEVTWDEFLLYCNFELDEIPPGVDAVSKPSKPLDWAPYDRDWGVGKRPAVGISWNSAKKYCEWLSLNTEREYRLPTEAEWELACGPAPANLDEHAWYQGTSLKRTEEVGKKQPNSRGLHDMLGNLWEYAQDPFDPSEPEGAVLRGGSWKDPAQDVTPTNRLAFDDDWTLADPNFPPGVWWIPDGDHLGMRLLRSGPDTNTTDD